MWLDGAPMVFLVISAVAFIIGLNLFAYLSHQVRQPPQSLLIQIMTYSSLDMFPSQRTY